MHQLYMHPVSFFSRRVLSLLVECDLAYEVRQVNLMAGEHKADSFLALNPNGQVPVMVDGDLVLAESNAILRYLCNVHALEGWYPADALARAKVDQWLDWTQSRLSFATSSIVFNALFAGPRADERALAKGKELLVVLVPILERQLSEFSYVAGDAPTIADLAVFSCLSQLALVGLRPEMPAIARWHEGMAALKGVAQAEAEMAQALAA